MYAIPLVLIFIAVLMFIGLVQRHTELSIMGILLLCVFGGAYGWSRLSRARLRCRLEVDKMRLFPDENLAVNLQVENAKLLPVWVRVQVATDQSAYALAAASHFSGQCGLLWYQSTCFSWQARALKRGVHSLGPTQVTTADLFGFFPAHRQEPPLEIIVYPRLVPLKPPDLPRRSMFGMPGTRSPVQDPVYILGTRDYQAGRPARTIHWKASARHNRLQEKIFDPSEQEKTLLILDIVGFAAHHAEDLFEQAIEAAASLAAGMERNGTAFGFATNADIVGQAGPILPVAGHRRQLPDLLELLARMKMSGGGDPGEIFLEHMSIPWGTSVVLFIHGPDQRTRLLSRYLAMRHIPALFIAGEADPQASDDAALAARNLCFLDQICMKEPVSP